MKKYFIIFVSLFVFVFSISAIARSAELIIWSVGQGQMVTYSDDDYCIHFDMGGEKFPLKKIFQECSKKENQVFFSHWDWDHINFTKKLMRLLSSFCRINSPGGIGSESKQKFLSGVPQCEEVPKDIFKEIIFSFDLNTNKKSTSSNKHSKVVVIKNRVLVPADSPGSSEPFWQEKIEAPIEILILSHHGSRFSTRESLLEHLPKLKMAIASARRKRYGHPHPLVKERLAKKGVPLLSTEDFNNIRIPLPSKE